MCPQHILEVLPGDIRRVGVQAFVEFVSFGFIFSLS